MLIVITLTLAIITNLILLRLYRRAAARKIAVMAAEYSALAEHYNDLEAENRLLRSQNNTFVYRMGELESRLRAMRRRQSLGLRAYEVGVNGLCFRYVRSAN